MKSNQVARNDAQEFERARYVAYLLRISPFKVFPYGPEHSEEANQHLVDYVINHVAELVDEAVRVKMNPGLKPARFHWYLRTLEHCRSVMDGTAEPADNDWFENKQGYRCGTYRPEGGAV